VHNWVAAGSADAGVVYATDAASTDRVEVVEELSEDLLSTKVIYPAGISAASTHRAEALLFVEFFASPEGLDIFKRYGFSPF
jgi:molybdate transport system substrate-binding protein